MIFLGMNVKEAAVNSIFIILLSQSAKLSFIGLGGGFSDYNLGMLMVMVPGAVIGGVAGSNLNKVLNMRLIDRSFNTALIMIIMLNLYNGYIGFLT